MALDKERFVTSSRWLGEMPYRRVVQPQWEIREALAAMKPIYERPLNRVVKVWGYTAASVVTYRVLRRDPGLGKSTLFEAHAEELLIAVNDGVLDDPDLIKLAWFSLLLRPRVGHDRFVPQAAKDFVNAVASGASVENRRAVLMDTLAAVSHWRRQSVFKENLPPDERAKATARMEPRVRALGSFWQTLDAVLLDPGEVGGNEKAGLIPDDLLLLRMAMSNPKALARLAAFMPDVYLGEMEAQAAAFIARGRVGDTSFLDEFRKRRGALDQNPKMNQARGTLAQSPLFALGSQKALLEAAAVAMSVFPSTHRQTQYSFDRMMGGERERRRRAVHEPAEIRSFVTLGEVIQGYWQKTWKIPAPGVASGPGGEMALPFPLFGGHG